MISALYNEKFPILNVDENFILREQLIEDSDAFFAYYTDPMVARYILATNPKTLAEASAEIHYCRSLFTYKRGIYWALARKTDNYMIGAIGLYINNQHQRAEICYDLSREYWNQGIMGKALRQVVAFCFNKINLNRIEAVTLKENVASISVLEKLGFSHEGCLKNYRYHNGGPHDVEMFAITPAQVKPSLLSHNLTNQAVTTA